jgi:hypothetical protein
MSARPTANHRQAIRPTEVAYDVSQPALSSSDRKKLTIAGVASVMDWF